MAGARFRVLSRTCVVCCCIGMAWMNGGFCVSIPRHQSWRNIFWFSDRKETDEEKEAQNIIFLRKEEKYIRNLKWQYCGVFLIVES